MNEYVCRVTMPEGYKDEKRIDVEKIIEKAITILNPDIKVHFGLFHTGVEWYSPKKTLDKE